MSAIPGEAFGETLAEDRLPRLRWVWLFALAASMLAWWARPVLPVDETRYLAVAWEMWRTGEFLVPHINGETYSHKPPLLFWLMHAGWSVTGVNDWWPRLLPFLFLTANALLVRRLGRLLWEGETGRRIGTLAAGMFMGSLYVFLFGSVIMFDLLLLAWVLLGWIALLMVHRGSSVARGTGLFGLAIGLGILAKGPVVLLFTLLPAFGAAHWSGRTRGRTGAVAATAALGTLLGAAIALAWAIPAGIHGGQEYRDAIFWGQTAGRVADSFAHARPVYWYLPILPAMLLPWPFLPSTWRGWKRPDGQPRGPRSDAWRFLAWATLPVFAFLCLMSGKQPHYLLPVCATLATVVAAHRVLHPGSQERTRWGHAALVGAIALFAGFLLVLPLAAEGRDDMQWFLEGWTPFPGLAMLAVAAAWIWLAGRPQVRPTLACLFPMVLLSGLHLSLSKPLHGAYDMSTLGARVAAWQAEGKPVAFFGAKFHGQFSFAGRLTEPVANPTRQNFVLDWTEANPDGVLLVLLNDHSPLSYSLRAPEVFPYASHRMAVWPADRFDRVHRTDETIEE
jgi:4-amino-4-deoxy-L-arabinose transferase-like glycosyltransferase